MISRNNRFHGYGSLRYVYRNGKTVRGPLCALKFVANQKRDTYRLSVVVSKKVSKSAVVRNRIRRRVYEAFRLQAEGIGSFDIVITIFNEEIGVIPHEELMRLVRAQLKQAKILQ